MPARVLFGRVADDRGRERGSVRVLQRGDQVVGRSGRDREEQAARGLRVGEQQLFVLGEVAEVDAGATNAWLRRVPPATMPRRAAHARRR